ncbi:hypothetical protein [Kitasatospora sp. NPDC094015]|uniref:hypothetical protein n=1 Tax=Kitasatospora sp. NPDC094015 TaxID=3155205 RepID=UPI00332034D5
MTALTPPGTGRHRRPKPPPLPEPEGTCGICDPEWLPTCRTAEPVRPLRYATNGPTQLGRHRVPRLDDPAPPGTVSLEAYRARKRLAKTASTA